MRLCVECVRPPRFCLCGSPGSVTLNPKLDQNCATDLVQLIRAMASTQSFTLFDMEYWYIRGLSHCYRRRYDEIRLWSDAPICIPNGTEKNTQTENKKNELNACVFNWLRMNAKWENTFLPCRVYWFGRGHKNPTHRLQRADGMWCWKVVR